MTPTRAQWTAHLASVVLALSAGCGGREALPVGRCEGPDAVVLGQEGWDQFAGLALDTDGNRTVAYHASSTAPTMRGTVIHTQTSDGCISSKLHRDVRAEQFAVDPSGEYIVMGTTTRHPDGVGGAFMKLDPLGQLTVVLGIENTAKSGSRSVYEIDVSPTGRVLVSTAGMPDDSDDSGMESAGHSYIYLNAVDPTGRLAAWRAIRQADPAAGPPRKAVIDLPNGNVLLLATVSGALELPNGPVSAAKGTVLAIELDESLAVTKVQKIEAMHHVQTAVADQDGAIYVAGWDDNYQPDGDLWEGQVVKLDAAMNVVWRSSLGPVAPSMLALDDAGQVHFVGPRTDDRRTDVAGRLASDGELLGTERYLTHEGRGVRAGGAIAIDPRGRRVVAGQTFEDDVLDCGEGPLRSSSPDVYLGTLPAP